MLQRALTFGVLSNPYRTVEAGQEFDYPTRLKWAVPVGAEEPEAPPQVPAPAPRGRKGPTQPPTEPDPI